MRGAVRRLVSLALRPRRALSARRTPTQHSLSRGVRWFSNAASSSNETDTRVGISQGRPTTGVISETMPKPAATFHSIGLPSYLWTKMKAQKFERPTLIQCGAIPRLLMQKHNPTRRPVKDLVISDMTGSGKTLAFVLPLIANVDNFSSFVQGVICVPTRELAVQIGNVVQELCRGGSKKRKANPVRVLRVMGSASNGLTVAETIQREKPHILIGTPQILASTLIQESATDPTKLVHIVCDEVDQVLSQPDDRKALLALLDLTSGTRPNIALRKNRDHESFAATGRAQVALVSATITDDVRRVAENVIPGYELITPQTDEDEWERRKSNYRIVGPTPADVAGSSTDVTIKAPLIPAHLTHRFIVCQENPNVVNLVAVAAKIIKAIRISRGTKGTTALVFVKSRHLVPDVMDYLRLHKLTVDGVHQSSSRQERSRAFRLASQGQLDALVGTDMLARGLDIEGVTDVINIGVPRSTNMYTHRAGRVGRLGGKSARDSNVYTVVGADHSATMFAYATAMGIEIVPSEVSHGAIQNTKDAFPANIQSARLDSDIVSGPLSPEIVVDTKQFGPAPWRRRASFAERRVRHRQRKEEAKAKARTPKRDRNLDKYAGKRITKRNIPSRKKESKLTRAHRAPPGSPW